MNYNLILKELFKFYKITNDSNIFKVQHIR